MGVQKAHTPRRPCQTLLLRNLTAHSHQRLLSNKLALGPRSGTSHCCPVGGTCASCQSKSQQQGAVSSRPHFHCLEHASPRTGSAPVCSAAHSATSKERKKEKTKQNRLFKAGCIILHILHGVRVWGFFCLSSQFLARNCFLTLVQDEPQSGWEIAVYSLGVWWENKKIKGLGTRQAGIQKNERRRMIHSGSTENRMTPRKQNDVIHHVGTEGLYFQFATVTLKKKL